MGAGGENGNNGNNDIGSFASRRRSSRLTELSQNILKRGSDVNTPQTIHLFCDYHAQEQFFIADLCCCQCEKEAIQAATYAATVVSGTSANGGSANGIIIGMKMIKK